MGRWSHAREVTGLAVLSRLVRDAARLPADLRWVLLRCRHPAVWSGSGKGSRKNALGADAESLLGTVAAMLGQPLNAYLADLRIEALPHLLSQTDLSVSEASQLLGYSETAALRRACRRRFGCSPRSLRVADLAEPSLPDKGAPPVEEVRHFAVRYAAALVAALPGLAPFEQAELVRNVPIAAVPLFHALSAKSREEGRNDRGQGVRWAALALTTVEANLLTLGEGAAALVALAHARLGNARRLAGDLDGAEADLRQAEALGEEALRLDPRTAAEVGALSATLHLYKRRFDLALGGLARALALAKEAGDAPLQVDILLQTAECYRYRGLPEKAVESLTTAIQVLGLSVPHDLGRRYLAHHGLTVALVEAEAWQAAEEMLPVAKRLAEEVGQRANRAGLAGAEGLIQAAKGRLEAAEVHLRNALDLLEAAGDLDARAVVTLELAIICQMQGRPAEVQTLVAEVLPIFETLRLEGEALTARQLLAAATQARQFSIPTLQRARRLLRELPLFASARSAPLA